MREPAPAWYAIASLDAPRAWAQGVALANGTVLLVGGIDRADGIVMRASTGASRVVADAGTGRMFHTLTVLKNDAVLAAGGVTRAGGDWTTLASAQVFDSWSGKWRAVAAMHQSRSDHGATLLADGRVLVAGGHVGPQSLRTVEAYDPTTDRWTLLAPLPLARWSFSLATLPDGRVLVAGGFEEPGEATDTSLYYDPFADRWTYGPDLFIARANHATVRLSNNDLLLVGGQRVAAGTAERYDVRSARFVFAGTLAEPRMAGQAGQRDDGSVVVMGGFLRPESGQGFIPNATAERWDPRANVWTAIAGAPTARADAVTVAIAGSVCVFGGSTRDDLPLASVECLR